VADRIDVDHLKFGVDRSTFLADIVCHHMCYPELVRETDVQKEGLGQQVINFAAAPTVFRGLRASSNPVPTTLRLTRASSAGEPLIPEVNEWAQNELLDLLAAFNQQIDSLR
jgi:hypothetical protein